MGQQQCLSGTQVADVGDVRSLAVEDARTLLNLDPSKKYILFFIFIKIELIIEDGLFIST